MPFVRTLLILLFTSLSTVCLAAVPDERPVVSGIGDLSIAKRYEFVSKPLSETREFYVSLPKSYEDSQHHYPVLYLLDADQNMEHTVASARMLAQWRGIPELIIVGIPSTNRLRDFTPTQDANYSEQSGGGEQFMAFVKQELIPFIDDNYRSHPFRILFGHSLSGLLAANEMMQARSPFDAYIIAAPSLWWNDFEILKSAGQHFKQNTQVSIAAFFGIGELDGYGMKQELLRFVDAIAASGNDKLRFDHQEYSDEGHMSAPMPVTYDGLLSVFADIPYSKEHWDSFSSDAFTAREESLRAKYGSTAVQTAENYIELANHLLEKRNFNGAITVFKLNAELNPGFAPYREWLANAYVLAGDVGNAKQEYQTAYDISSTSINGQGNAQQYLEQLELITHPIALNNEIISSLSGCYENKEDNYTIYAENGKLYGRHKDWQAFELFPKSTMQFFMRVPPGYQFSFVEENSGMTLLLDKYGEQSRLLPTLDGCQKPMGSE